MVPRYCTFKECKMSTSMGIRIRECTVYQNYIKLYISGLKVGWMTWTIWVTWVTFGGSSGSHPQTKLFGCDLDITCSLENSVGIW